MSHNPTAISPPSVSDSTIDDLAELVKIEENLVIAQDDQPFIDQNQALNSSLQNTYTPVDDDPDDPIVHRIPVFLSQELANELYLVQYPLRPADRPYTDVGPLVEASIKEKQRRLTMSFTVDQAGPHYDHDADYDMPLLKLSSYPVPPKTNFAAGIYRNERIYLTPLHATVRMLPSLDHIDDALDEERIETERRKNGGLPPTKDDDDDMAPVMLRFKRQGTVDGISARRITYQYLQTLKDNEPWQPIAIHDDQDDLNAMHVASDAERIKNRLGLVPQHNVQFPLSAAEYLRYVNDPDTVFGDSDIPIEYLGSKTPLEQRLSHLLLSAKVVSFGQICQKLQIRTPAEVTQVLSLLINTTFLIHGNFVYKSESIYNLKAFRGFYKTVLCRNIVLAFFARNYTVNRKDIVNVVSVDEATLTELLEELAVRVGETEMWNFKLPIDNQFIQHFPDYVAIEGEKPYKLYDHTLFLLNPSR